MDNLNLDSGESVIHTTQELIINGVGYEAALTGSRLILVDHDSGTPRVNIPFASIGLAVAGTNRLREPVIQLTYSTPDGSSRGIELIFIYQDAHRNFQNRDKCMEVIRDRGVPVRLEPYRATPSSLNRKESMDAGTLELDQPSGRPAVPEWTIYGISQGSKNTLPEEPAPTSPIVTFIVVFLIAAIFIAAMIVPIPGPDARQPAPGQAAPAPATSMTPVTAATPAPSATPAPEITLAPGAAPTNGIWVRVSCPGGYTGSLRAQGWNTDVNGSGTLLYQMPVSNTTIEGSIEKTGGSAETLIVEVFNGGIPVSNSTTAKPYGLVELHIPVGLAIVNSPAPVPAPVPAVTAGPTLDASAAASGVPPAGIFVRVVYPGQYSGSISGNGLAREVNSSGARVYQVPLSSGTIDAYIEKGDASVRDMTVQVYKDGTLVTSGSTSRPQGMVEIHTAV